MKIRRIAPKDEGQKKKAAAYARVSTIYESQEDSFENQCAYYTQMILKNPEWEFVKVYADKGKSGLSAEKRPGFQEMMTDARAGKINILFCKSISRFARNAIEAQQYVKELMEHGVEVRFQRENLSSTDLSAEMMFNILAALAQEESRSISEKVKWAYQKRAQKGICHLGNNRVLGMDEVNGKLAPNQDAWIVKRIFEEYAAGRKLVEIAAGLEYDGIKGLRGGTIHAKTILSILKNEIYVGDRCLQKKPPKNYLTKKPDYTVPYDSYYIRNDHEGIVDRELWNQVQIKLHPPLENMIICGVCGEPLHRRKRQGKIVWTCLSDSHKHKTVEEEKVIAAITATAGFYHPSQLPKTVKQITFDGKRISVEGPAESERVLHIR